MNKNVSTLLHVMDFNSSVPNHYLSKKYCQLSPQENIQWHINQKIITQIADCWQQGMFWVSPSNCWNTFIWKFLFTYVLEVGMIFFTIICHCGVIAHTWLCTRWINHVDLKLVISVNITTNTASITVYIVRFTVLFEIAVVTCYN